MWVALDVVALFCAGLAVPDLAGPGSIIVWLFCLVGLGAGAVNVVASCFLRFTAAAIVRLTGAWVSLAMILFCLSDHGPWWKQAAVGVVVAVQLLHFARAFARYRDRGDDA
jgi:hypothetical protein